MLTCKFVWPGLNNTMLTTNLSLTLCHNYDTLTSTGEGTPSMAKKSNFGEDSPAEEEVKAAGETGKMFGILATMWIVFIVMCSLKILCYLDKLLELKAKGLSAKINFHSKNSIL